MEKAIMKIKNVLLIIFFAVIFCVESSCEKQEDSKDCENNYLKSTFNEELNKILFDDEPYKYRVSYNADYCLANVDGKQELIYLETFFVYEEDSYKNMLSCKTVIITEPNLRQEDMEEYIKDAYGDVYEYTKLFENVYVHNEVVDK